MEIVLVMLAVVGSTTASQSVLDLSYTYNLDPPASHTVNVIEKSMNRIYIGVELNQICSTGLTGTHLEAPTTYNNYTTYSVDELPVDRLWRVPGVVINVQQFLRNSYMITAEVLQNALNRERMSIPDGGIVLIYTGFISDGDLSDDDDTETPNRQPRLTSDAGLWLANYGSEHGHTTGIIGVGTDLNSLDQKDTNMTTSARARLYEFDIYALHNLKNLNMVPISGFLVTVMPMKIFKGDNAPVRVLAEPQDMRSRPSVYNNSDNKHDDDGDWHSESDYGYPGPRYVGGVMVASSVTSYSNPLLMGLPIFMVLIRGG